ncbi:polysaccharide pyruvyl transferase family protein [Arthrobacter sp. zg-ZUI100]|uniref:polysaccharide pyruvyl transferase family protein n=1 Tax=Arthrobacter jiangjiafuii TaxID=2817475 RepID=UPI001AEF0C15|nr:polysaccharide pyruvyl transferase family protein [Arthrobacter jiangjiafuii]MBP3037156.1 polysaccharide pyruvyl transferase family protein [Arthrobacter jiangjiafuii]
MTLPDIQSTTVSILSKHLRPGERVALVDFPNHANSGDSLIYLGELKYLSQLGVVLGYVADASRYNVADLCRLVPEGPILIHGGGNFGDRWVAMQEMRERVIADFPDRRIIQLPQGIEFSPGPVLQQAQAVLGKHKHLTLLIRDHASVTLTRKLFPKAEVEFCPDMAFGYGSITWTKRPDHDVVVVKRRDSESATEEIPIGVDHLEEDWGLKGWRNVLAKSLRAPGALIKRIPQLGVPLYPLQRRCYDALAKMHVRNAVRICTGGRVVVTDRLHAAVIAGLMGKPVIGINNANGKIKAIYSDYLHQLSGVRFAPNSDAVRAVVREVLDTL